MNELPPITSVFLNLTDECNMRCIYCFVKQSPKTIPIVTAKAVVDFLVTNCVGTNETPSINFFGGEPTLCWDSIIVPLTLYIRKDLNIPFALSMTSNGVLLSDDRIAFMKRYDIGLLLSIDGGQDTQNINRPMASHANSFDLISKRLPSLIKFFPDLTFRSTLIPKTCHNLFEDIMFAIHSGFQNYFVMPNSFEPWDDGSQSELQKQLRHFSDYYIQSCRNNENPIYFQTFEKCFSQIRWINHAVANHQDRISDGCHACGKCGLGASHYAAVDTEGNLYSCQEMSSHDNLGSPFHIGNIFDGVDNEKRLALIKLFDSRRVNGSGCKSCKLNSICDGGCIMNNYLANGSMHEMPEIYCLWCQTLLDEAIYVATVLGHEKNEFFKARWEKPCL